MFFFSEAVKVMLAESNRFVLNAHEEIDQNAFDCITHQIKNSFVYLVIHFNLFEFVLFSLLVRVFLCVDRWDFFSEFKEQEL